jgi:glycosyltransferase involved in cell wall biosynthesis
MIMQRPVISGDSETVRAELTHKEHLYLVERQNPLALAQAILDLEANPQLRQHIAQSAYQRVQQNTIAGTGQQTVAALSTIL